MKNAIIRIADWKIDNKDLAQIRRKVFIEEQNVPASMEWDEYDELSTHYLVTLENKAIACARLKPDGQIGRMAVLVDYRNQGIGNSLLQLVLQNAIEKNFKQLHLHAQVSAIPFYKKHGFNILGDIFFEANIPHSRMLKKIC